MGQAFQIDRAANGTTAAGIFESLQHFIKLHAKIIAFAWL
jgi:hypothetical protein